MRLSFEPVRQRICAGHTGHTGDLFSVIFLVLLSIAILCTPLLSRAQTAEAQPKQAAGEPAEGQVQSQPDVKDESSLEEKWGIQVIAVRLTAAKTMVDFRYRVVDAAKAKPLLDRKENPYLLDQASGAKLSVPASKVGNLRATSNPIAGRNYFILFQNTRSVVKAGSRVTIAIGEFRAENLTVQ